MHVITYARFLIILLLLRQLLKEMHVVVVCIYPKSKFEFQETLTGVSVNVTNEFGLSVVPWRNYRRTHVRGYMCTLPTTYPHTIVWDLSIEYEVDTTSYSAGMFHWGRRDAN